MYSINRNIKLFNRLNLFNFLMISLVLTGCRGDDLPDLDFRQEMRDFVIGISKSACSQDSDFIIIPQNGIELITGSGNANNSLSAPYLSAIDGHGQEDLFFGYDADDQATPRDESEYLTAFLDRSMDEGKVILVTDYCSTNSNMDKSYQLNKEKGYISFAADRRELDDIPGYPTVINQENDSSISDLNEVKNFLYLINYDGFGSKPAMIGSVISTNYDLLIMDLYFDGNNAFSASEIDSLKTKANGGKRLVICYLSIGEAEDYRYYWKQGWKPGHPSWLEKENPDWQGNYKVRYWDKEWQGIIYGNDSSYVQKIIDSGFDGVYLDIIDAYEYFE